MTKSALPAFPDWVPKAVRQQAKELWKTLPTQKDSAKAQQVLEQLIVNPLMKRVWEELYRKKRDESGQFFNPACLTYKSEAAAYREKARILREKGGQDNKRDAEYLEVEAQIIERLPQQPTNPKWNEQDHAVTTFLSRAYRAALYTEPVLAADVRAIANKLRGFATQLRDLSTVLQSVKIGVTEIYADKLIDIAMDCESDAMLYGTNDPRLVHRKRGDTIRKTYVALLFSATDYLFGKPLYNTIANVTNVVFSKESVGNRGFADDIKPDTVREMLRGYPLRIRPSFGRFFLRENKWRAAQLEATLHSKEKSQRLHVQEMIKKWDSKKPNASD